MRSLPYQREKKTLFNSDTWGLPIQKNFDNYMTVLTACCPNSGHGQIGFLETAAVPCTVLALNRTVYWFMGSALVHGSPPFSWEIRPRTAGSNFRFGRPWI